MVGHIHIMIIELLMKLDVILKNVGCTVTKMLDQNMSSYIERTPTSIFGNLWICQVLFNVFGNYWMLRFLTLPC